MSPVLLGNIDVHSAHYIDKRLTFSEGYSGLNVSSQTLYPLWMLLLLHSVLPLSLLQQTQVLLLKSYQVILIVTHWFRPISLVYCIARNFQALEFLWFSQIPITPQKFYPPNLPLALEIFCIVTPATRADTPMVIRFSNTWQLLTDGSNADISIYMVAMRHRLEIVSNALACHQIHFPVIFWHVASCRCS